MNLGSTTLMSWEYNCDIPDDANQFNSNLRPHLHKLLSPLISPTEGLDDAGFTRSASNATIASNCQLGMDTQNLEGRS
jgi:hypothetical protein